MRERFKMRLSLRVVRIRRALRVDTQRVLEVGSLVALHAWNSEVFAAVMGLVGTVTGIFVARIDGLVSCGC